MGRPGRRVLADLLPGIRTELSADLVIANGENAAAGFGLTDKTAQEIFDTGVDVITSGNHIWDNKDIIPHLDREAPILRPANYPDVAPGRGWLTQKGVAVLNLQGRTFMSDTDCPFRKADGILETLSNTHVVIVDMHAEATSEKEAMGRYLDGRVSAVIGTHTHVPTADTRLLPGGTAYVSDAGMTGPTESIIGNDIDAVLERFLTGVPVRLPVADKSPTLHLNAVLVEVDEQSGRARSITRADREIEVHGQ
jgi:metallophosphoesterase (TIGR00282 family)